MEESEFTEMVLSCKSETGEEGSKEPSRTTNLNADMSMNRSKEIKLEPKKEEEKEVSIPNNFKMELKPEYGKALTMLSPQHIKSEPFTDSDDEKILVIDESSTVDIKQESEENFTLVLPTLDECEDQKTLESDDDIEYEFCDEEESCSLDQMFDFRYVIIYEALNCVL